MAPTTRSTAAILGKQSSIVSDDLSDHLVLPALDSDSQLLATSLNCKSSIYSQPPGINQVTMGRSKILPVRRLSPEVAMQVNLVWEMARGSFATNSDRIVVPQNVVQSIGNAGLEELKYRLR